MTAAAAAHAAPPAVELVRLDVRPAWHGLVRPGAITELAVDLVSPAGGAVTVEARAGGDVSALTTHADPGAPLRLTLPVRIAADADAVTVVARVPGLSDTTRTVSVAPVDGGPVVAVVGGGADRLLRDAPRAWQVTDVDPAELPSSADAYGATDAIVLDPTTLALAPSAARAALARHLARCGRVLLRGEDSRDAQATLLAHAACGGRLVRTPAGDEGLVDEVAALLATRVEATPSSAELRTLDGPATPAAWPALRLFFASYAAILGLGAVVARRAAALVGLSLAATALLVLGMSASPAVVQLAAWTEGVQGERLARVSALVSVDGFAPGTATLVVPAALGVPASDAARAGEAPVRALHDAGATTATVPTALLSRRALRVESTTVTPPLQVSVAGDAIAVENRGAEAMPAGFAQWGGRFRRLPALQAGQRWTATRDDPAVEPPLPAWAMRRALAGGAPSVLVPWSPPALAALDATRVSAWTLLRIDAAGATASAPVGAAGTTTWAQVAAESDA